MTKFGALAIVILPGVACAYSAKTSRAPSGAEQHVFALFQTLVDVVKDGERGRTRWPGVEEQATRSQLPRQRQSQDEEHSKHAHAGVDQASTHEQVQVKLNFKTQDSDRAQSLVQAHLNHDLQSINQLDLEQPNVFGTIWFWVFSPIFVTTGACVCLCLCSCTCFITYEYFQLKVALAQICEGLQGSLAALHEAASVPEGYNEEEAKRHRATKLQQALGQLFVAIGWKPLGNAEVMQHTMLRPTLHQTPTPVPAGGATPDAGNDMQVTFRAPTTELDSASTTQLYSSVLPPAATEPEPEAPGRP